MVKSTILANAVATVTGAGYVLCRLLFSLAPQFFFNIEQGWFHTLNLESIRATRPMPLPMLALGFITSVVISWVATYAVAELYNRWAKA